LVSICHVFISLFWDPVANIIPREKRYFEGLTAKYFSRENIYVYGSIFSCPSTDVPSFVEKYLKIKYTIFDGSPLAIDFCKGSFKLLNGLH
jgi:hypothetical protein